MMEWSCFPDVELGIKRKEGLQPNLLCLLNAKKYAEVAIMIAITYQQGTTELSASNAPKCIEVQSKNCINGPPLGSSCNGKS